jgi:hypothetical protein
LRYAHGGEVKEVEDFITAPKSAQALERSNYVPDEPPDLGDGTFLNFYVKGVARAETEALKFNVIYLSTFDVQP